MDVADLLPMGHIPLEIMKEIIKKMKLRSVIRLQRSTKWCDDLVQECHSPMLDKYYRVAKRRASNPWKGEENERKFIEFTITAHRNQIRRLSGFRRPTEAITAKLNTYLENLNIYIELHDVWKAIFSED